MTDRRWPPLPYDEWKDTYATLHMWSQVVGKVALAQAPPLNHSWGVTLHLTPRGLATATLPHGERTFTLELDFIDHRLAVRASGEGPNREGTLPLRPMTVAAFYADVMALLRRMELPVEIWPMPVEVPSPVRFDRDTEHRSYEPELAHRFWRLLSEVERVLAGTRCTFVGKCSPVHFFWGAFDLAVTRFSGRRAPAREGPAFMREAYSHEVISHGFWPGSGPVLEPTFYAYAVPEPAGFRETKVQPAAAYYHRDLGEFLLPYETVRTAASPEQAIRDFVQSTYDAGATLGRWDRPALER